MNCLQKDFKSPSWPTNGVYELSRRRFIKIYVSIAQTLCKNVGGSNSSTLTNSVWNWLISSGMLIGCQLAKCKNSHTYVSVFAAISKVISTDVPYWVQNFFIDYWREVKLHQFVIVKNKKICQFFLQGFVKKKTCPWSWSNTSKIYSCYIGTNSEEMSNF